MTIQFYDLAGTDENLRFSPFCWRVRMALAHKGLPYEPIPWRYSEKAKLAEQEFVGGSKPTFANYIVFGALQWARCISPISLIDQTDPVYAGVNACWIRSTARREML